MGTWDTYQARLEVNGVTKRERVLNHTKSYISDKIVDSLSCHEVIISGSKQTVSILNEKEDLAIKISNITSETINSNDFINIINDIINNKKSNLINTYKIEYEYLN